MNIVYSSQFVSNRTTYLLVIEINFPSDCTSIVALHIPLHRLLNLHSYETFFLLLAYVGYTANIFNLSLLKSHRDKHSKARFTLL